MKLVYILTLILGANSIKAQDTIFVYDTIRIYDTIKVEKSNEINRAKGVYIINDSTYLKNNDTLSATILKNDIIVDETIKKIKAMRKINLFGVLLIAIQNITLAQHDFGIQFGITGFGTTDNVKEVSNPLTPGIKAGVYYIHNFNEKIGLEMGVN